MTPRLTHLTPANIGLATIKDDSRRSRDAAVVGDLSSTVGWASSNGNALPVKIRRSSNAKYEPSERSVITDLGRRERDRIAARTGHHRPPQALPVGAAELKRPIQDRLVDILHEIPGHEERKGFFPEATLMAMIDKECVEQVLKASFTGVLPLRTIKRMAQKICGHGQQHHGRHALQYKKVFVTLVLSEKINSIRLFLDDEVSDDDLPLAKVRREDGRSKFFGLARRGEPDVSLRCFGDWTNLAIMRFEEWQWCALAPFFNRSERKNVGHWVLKDQIPLPFIADSRYDENIYDRLEFEGGNSTVFKVDIHPEHHSFCGPDVRTL